MLDEAAAVPGTSRVSSRTAKVYFSTGHALSRPATVGFILGLLACAGAIACGGTPAGPSGGLLATGRWTGNGACLAVAENGCNLVVGCGHGQFPRVTVRRDGTFEVDGTYRIEAGPISIEPAPPAHFSGLVNGSRLQLTVMPTADSLPVASYSIMLSGTGTCSVPCV